MKLNDIGKLQNTVLDQSEKIEAIPEKCEESKSSSSLGLVNIDESCKKILKNPKVHDSSSNINKSKLPKRAKSSFFDIKENNNNNNNAKIKAIKTRYTSNLNDSKSLLLGSKICNGRRISHITINNIKNSKSGFFINNPVFKSPAHLKFLGDQFIKKASIDHSQQGLKRTKTIGESFVISNSINCDMNDSLSPTHKRQVVGFIDGNNSLTFSNRNPDNQSYLQHILLKRNTSKFRLSKKNVMNFGEDWGKQKRMLVDLEKKIINKETAIYSKKLNVIYFFYIICAIFCIIFSIFDNDIYSTKSKYFLSTIFYNSYNNEEKIQQLNLTDENITYIINSIYFVEKIRNKDFDIKIMEKRKLTAGENILRFLNVILSILLVLFDILIYKYEKEFLLKLNNGNHVNAERKIMKKKYLVIECIILVIFYPPFVNKVAIGSYFNISYTYSLNSIFLFLNLLKLYAVYKFLIHSSFYNSIMGQILCKSNYTKITQIFIIRSYLKKKPILFTLLSCIVIVITFSFILYYLELFVERVSPKTQSELNISLDGKKLVNTISHLILFFICITNVESVPYSLFGKSILIIGGILCMIFIFNFYSVIFEIIRFTHNQKKAYSKLQKLFMPENKEHKATNLIRDFLRIRYLHIQHNKNKELYKKQFQDCLYTIHETEDHINSRKLEIIELNKTKNSVMFYKIYIILKLQFINNIHNFENEFKIARNYSMQFDDILEKVGEKLHDNGTSLDRKLDSLYDIDITLDDIMIKQKKIRIQISEIFQYSQMLMKYLLKRHNDNYKEKNLSPKSPLKKNKSFYNKSPNNKLKLFSLENTGLFKKTIIAKNEEAKLVRANTNTNSKKHEKHEKHEKVHRRSEWS